MSQLRHNVIRAGLDALYFSGAHRLLRPLFAGVGTIFTLHHVRPARDAAFQPNSHLEITPEFLRSALTHLRDLDVDIVSIDEAYRRLLAHDFKRRFATFTFDDGYRDNRVHALPIMREFNAPFAVYVVSDFADGRGQLWWIALERLIAAVDSLDLDMDGTHVHLDMVDTSDKIVAYWKIADWLRTKNGETIHREISRLCAMHGIDDASIARDLCLSWDELKSLSDDPLVTVGAHTISHCNLAYESAEEAQREIRASREQIESHIGKPVQHFAFPYGDKTAATSREFAMAHDLGFKTAMTGRPGMVFAGNAAHLTALPRISLNGNYQSNRHLEVLTSGVATAVWNSFRRVNAA